MIYNIQDPICNIYVLGTCHRLIYNQQVWQVIQSSLQVIVSQIYSDFWFSHNLCKKKKTCEFNRKIPGGVPLVHFDHPDVVFLIKCAWMFLVPGVMAVGGPMSADPWL